jgi:thymidylate kinase
MKKQNIIIFEGPDGCGKSNIAAELSSQTSIPVFKNESEWEHFPKGSKTDYFLNAIRFAHPHLLQYFKQTSTSVILDRAYPSELVYSRIFGRTTDHGALRHCDDLCAEMGAKIIVPHRSSYASVVDQFDFVDEEFLKKVHDGYMDFLSWTNCDTYLLNVDDENLEREMDDITKFLGEIRQ